MVQLKAYDGELYSEVLNFSVSVAPNRSKHAVNITCIDSPTYSKFVSSGRFRQVQKVCVNLSNNSDF